MTNDGKSSAGATLVHRKNKNNKMQVFLKRNKV